MASKVDVFNLALTNISTKAFVNSLTEDSVERKYCSANYDAAVESVLEDHDWNFSSAYKTLALTSVAAQTPWMYQYEYPSDCVKVREIMRATDDSELIPFRVDLDTAGTGKIIHTDMTTAVARYTKRVLTPGLFSALAVEALGWKLATRVVVPLTNDLNLKQNAEQEYARVLVRAQSSNFNEGDNRKTPVPSHIQARG